jgi:hypothetical protein
MAKKESAETTKRNNRWKTRKKYSVEEKIRIVIVGLRGESTVAELCRREGITQSLYYKPLMGISMVKRIPGSRVTTSGVDESVMGGEFFFLEAVSKYLQQSD